MLDDKHKIANRLGQSMALKEKQKSHLNSSTTQHYKSFLNERVWREDTIYQAISKQHKASNLTWLHCILTMFMIFGSSEHAHMNTCTYELNTEFDWCYEKQLKGNVKDVFLTLFILEQISACMAKCMANYHMQCPKTFDLNYFGGLAKLAIK